MQRLLPPAGLILLVTGSLLAGCRTDPVAHRQQGAPPCELALTLDDLDGEFNGMSHSGTLLRLKNSGKGVCHVSAWPQITFTDGAGVTLPITRQVPPDMHSGPEVPMLELRPGKNVSGTLRWVAGNVYERGRCFTPAAIAVVVEEQAVRENFTGQICGQQGHPATFEQGWLSEGK